MDTEMVVKQIRIDRIDTTGQMVRAGMDDDHVIELSNSIGKIGLLEPIVVEPAGVGRFQLIAGAHRLMACQRLNWTHIPANVRPADKANPVKGLALVENLIRRDMSLREECEAIRILTTEQEMSVSQVCQLLGRGREWVNKRLVAPTYEENLREALFAGLVSLAAAEEIATVEDVGAQNVILNEVIYGKRGLHETKSLVETYKAVPSIGEAVAAGLRTAGEIQATRAPKKACEYKGEVVRISDMKLLWLCAECCNEIFAVRDMIAADLAKGGESVDTIGTDRDHEGHEGA